MHRTNNVSNMNDGVRQALLQGGGGVWGPYLFSYFRCRQNCNLLIKVDHANINFTGTTGCALLSHTPSSLPKRRPIDEHTGMDLFFCSFYSVDKVRSVSNGTHPPHDGVKHFCVNLILNCPSVRVLAKTESRLFYSPNLSLSHDVNL